MHYPICSRCKGRLAPIVSGVHLSESDCAYQRIRDRVMSSETERWLVAQEWCNLTDIRGEGRHPLSLEPSGFRYDGCGFFAPQSVSWEKASRQLAESGNIKGATSAGVTQWL
jgi:hypothetical protein